MEWPLAAKSSSERRRPSRVVAAGFVTQGRSLFAHPAEPAEQMGIAAQLRRPADLREGSLPIAEEAVGHTSIVGEGFGSRSS